MKTITFAMTLLVLVAFAQADIWSYCGTSADHFTIKNVTIVPDPPTKNSSITITADGTLDEEVTDGKAHILLYFSGIKILDNTYDACTLDPQIKCPFPKGPTTLKVSEFLPSDVPSGHYTGTVTLNDQNNSEITCIKVDFHL